MTKYAVSGYIGFDNFGDEVIASVLAKYLKSNGAEKITWISSNPEKTSRLYGVSAVKMLDFYNAIKKCDVLISGGGSLLQDITSLKSLVYYILVISTAILLNKKVYIFAQGFTPFRTKIGEFMTRFVLKRCHYVSVRDTKSQNLLSSWGIASELVEDPAYAIDIPECEHKGVGIQLRSFPTLTNAFLKTLANKIAEKFPNKKIKLISLQDSIDMTTLKQFASMLEKRGCNTVIVSNLSIESAITEISKLEYLISMRFHACLVGAKAGVKVLGISYDEKVEKLAQNTGFPYVELNKIVLDDIFNVEPEKYNIPSFRFPEI